MDLILGRFLDSAGGSLDDDSREGLERLLDRSDQEILDWIGGRATPPADAGLATVIERIRAACNTPGVER